MNYCKAKSAQSLKKVAFGPESDFEDDQSREENLLAGENHQSSHQEDDSENNKQCVTHSPPAGAVVQHLGRLQKHEGLK